MGALFMHMQPILLHVSRTTTNEQQQQLQANSLSCIIKADHPFFHPSSRSNHRYIAPRITGTCKEEMANDAPSLPPCAMERGTPAHNLNLAYLSRYSTPEAALLRELRQETAARFGMGAVMLTGHMEGMLLQLLIRITGSKRVLEFGTFTGYSALAMAMGLPEGGRVVTCDPNREVTEVAKRFFGRAGEIGGRIEVVNESGMATLEVLKGRGEVFDMVFVDANKPDYRNYVKFLLDHDMVKRGGFFVCDNVLFMGEVPNAALEKEGHKVVWDESRWDEFVNDEKSRQMMSGLQSNAKFMHEFNEYMRDEQRVQQLCLPIRDGITIAVVV